MAIHRFFYQVVNHKQFVPAQMHTNQEQKTIDELTGIFNKILTTLNIAEPSYLRPTVSDTPQVLNLEPYSLNMKVEETVTRMKNVAHYLIEHFKEKAMNMKASDDGNSFGDESVEGNSIIGHMIRYQLSVALFVALSHAKKSANTHIWDIITAANGKLAQKGKADELIAKSYSTCIAAVNTAVMTTKDKGNLKNAKFVAFICKALK